MNNLNIQVGKLHENTWFSWFELLTLYLIIPLLIVFNVVELRFRWLLFAIIFLYVGRMLWIIKPSLSDLGINNYSSKRILFLCSSYSIVILLVCLILYFRDILSGSSLLFYLIVLIIYPIVSAPIQEVFFRSYFFHRYSELTHPYILGVLNILLFAFYHKIYGDWLAVWLSLVGGLILTLLYIIKRNFFWNWIIHGMLGVLVFVTGFGKYFTDLIK